MNGRTAGILVQVAYKGVIDSGRELTTDNIVADYKLLENVFNELGINPDEGNSNSGGNRRSSGGSSNLPDSVRIFTHNGASWYDFRAAKDNGDVKKGYPDFKTVDWKESVYIYDKQGNANSAALPLVNAADSETAPL